MLLNLSLHVLYYLILTQYPSQNNPHVYIHANIKSHDTLTIYASIYIHNVLTYTYIIRKKERERHGESVNIIMIYRRKGWWANVTVLFPERESAKLTFRPNPYTYYIIYIWLYVTQDIRYDYSSDYSQQYPNHLAFPFVLSHENYLYIYVICTHKHNCIKFQ